MLRLLKVVLALGIPTIVVFVLIHSGLRNMSTASLAEWFTGYLIAIAAPQLVVIWVGTIRSFPTWAVVGALVALDTWLIFIAWSIFHSTDYAGASWLVYLGRVTAGRSRRSAPRQGGIKSNQAMELIANRRVTQL